MHDLHNMPEDSWVRIKDHHEAIVSEALFDAAQERLIPRDYVRHAAEPDGYGELMEIAYCGHCDKPLINKNGKYYCKKCKVEIDERIIHQSLLLTAMDYQKTLPNPDKMNRTKWNALCQRDLVVAGAKQEAERAWSACDELMGQSARGEITNEEFKGRNKKLMAALKETEAEYDRQTKEREIFESQMKECVQFVRDARRLTNKEIPGEGVNPEDLGIVKQLISKAMLTKGPDGRRITVEMRMAEQIKKFFDWWTMFVPEVILVENSCTCLLTVR